MGDGSWKGSNDRTKRGRRTGALGRYRMVGVGTLEGSMNSANFRGMVWESTCNQCREVIPKSDSLRKALSDASWHNTMTGHSVSTRNTRTGQHFSTDED